MPSQTHNEQSRIRFRRIRSTKAFTLVELMVVLVILALLAGVVTVSVRSYLLRSKQNVAKLEISKMMQAIESFYATMNRYPTNAEGLEILAAKTDEISDGFLTFVPTDPWGNAYEYRSPGLESEYEILCFGEDRREGGTGKDRDITSNELSRARKGAQL
jgi:general secretion pathway protein G